MVKDLPRSPHRGNHIRGVDTNSHSLGYKSATMTRKLNIRQLILFSPYVFNTNDESNSEDKVCEFTKAVDYLHQTLCSGD